MRKSINSTLIVILLIVSPLMFSGFIFASSHKGISDGRDHREYTSISLVEERIFSKATLENDFADDKILVIMNRQETMRFREYATRDFSEIGVREVKELTRSSSIALREKISRKRSLFPFPKR